MGVRGEGPVNRDDGPETRFGMMVIEGIDENEAHTGEQASKSLSSRAHGRPSWSYFPNGVFLGERFCRIVPQVLPVH